MSLRMSESTEGGGQRGVGILALCHSLYTAGSRFRTKAALPMRSLWSMKAFLACLCRPARGRDTYGNDILRRIHCQSKTLRRSK